VHTCSFQHYTTGKPRATVSRHLAPTTVADTSPHTSRPAMRDPALERAVIGTRNPSRFFRDPCCVCVCVPDQIVTRCRCLWELDDGVCVECLKYFPLRDEPGKTGAPCVKVPGSSRVPVTDQPQYRGLWHSSSSSARSLSRSPSSPPPSFTQSPSHPRSLVRDGQTSPHRPRLVVRVSEHMSSTRVDDHGEERSADAASWRGPEGGQRRRASDPFRIHTTSHAHTARSRVRPILTPSSS
jgi:hypothetical protein